MENLKLHLLRWKKNREVIESEKFLKKELKDISSPKIKKQQTGIKLNSKTIKNFENLNELLVTHYDD